MFIKSIIITGLYGYINKKVNFLESDNYLIGISGSGKSSILKIIDSFFKKDFQYFNKLNFKNIIIETDENEYKIESLGLNNQIKEIYIFDKNYDFNIKKEEGKRLKAELDTLLDDGDNNSSNERLDKIEEVRMQIIELENVSYVITEDLKDYLILPESDLLFSIGIELENLEFRIAELFKNDLKSSQEPLKYLIEAIIPIKRVGEILKEIEKKSLQALSYQNEKEKLNELTKKNNKTNEEIAEIENKYLELSDMSKEINGINSDLINEYIKTINLFLEDSYKKIIFNSIKGEFSIDVLNKHKEKIKIIKELKNLSSGEKEILILLTDLFFNLKDDSIILIDEPENSIHIEWQRNYIPELLKIISKRKNIQLIVATHSPDLLGTVEREKIIPLYPFNSEVAN